MTLLSPAGLLWLLSVPVLLWLWRLASTQRQVQVPSLIPFEHLVKRPPHRRSRVVVNRLFWLQLAALLGLILALAQPVIVQRRAKTVLVILDNSASMGARGWGPTAFDRAVRAVRSRLHRKAPGERWLVLTTSPVEPLAREPSSDAGALDQALDAVRVSHLGGHLATTEGIGRALLGAEPDATLIVTDEPRPADASDKRLAWVTVGGPLPNAGFVGVEAQGPLCAPAPSRLIATVQNFSGDPRPVAVQAVQGHRTLSAARLELAPGQRQAAALDLPEDVRGTVELRLEAAHDALEADNRAWVDVGRRAMPPVFVQSASPGFLRVVSKWLGACEALAWSATAAPAGPFVLVTDRDDDGAADAVLRFEGPANARPIRSQWLAAADHPLTAYVEPLQVVSAALSLDAASPAGTPVIWSVLNGRRWPVAAAQETGGRRRVVLRLDPAASGDATPILLAFFNSLRWLGYPAAVPTTGSPIALPAAAPGTLTVRRPDGATDRVVLQPGEAGYAETRLAGAYRLEQGGRQQTVWVNFFNPVESNVAVRASTWQPPAPAAPAAAARATHPLTRWLVGLALLVLLAEWALYAAKGAAAGRPSGAPSR